MPKNPNKRKINVGSVSHVTWVTKQTTRGPRTSLIRLDPVQSPTLKSQPHQSSPVKTISSLSQVSSQGYNEEHMDFEDLQPLRVPEKKVLWKHVFMQDINLQLHLCRPHMTISMIGFPTRSFYRFC